MKNVSGNCKGGHHAKDLDEEFFNVTREGVN